MKTERELIERIKDLKQEIKVLEYVLYSEDKPKNYTFGRPVGTYKYTQEQIDFLKECEEKGLDDKEIVKLFNLKYKKNYSFQSRALYNFMIRTGIKKKTNNRKNYTQEEDEFILNNKDKLSQFEIAKALKRTRDSVKNRIILLAMNEPGERTEENEKRTEVK